MDGFCGVPASRMDDRVRHHHADHRDWVHGVQLIKMEMSAQMPPTMPSIAEDNMNDTPYYKARMRASEKDAAFESRLSTSAVIGIGTTRLYQIERGIRLPHEDEVMIMAKRGRRND